MANVTVNGIYYNIEEKGDGEPLLLLHGFTGSAQNWREPAGQLAQHYRTIAVDLPGHGQTAVPDDPTHYSMEQTAVAIDAILTHLAAEPAHLLGYSMGGRLALYLAITRPWLIKSLILESASPGLKSEAERDQRRRQDESLANFIEREGIEAFVERWEQLPLWASQAQLPRAIRDRLHLQRLQNNPQGLAHSLRAMGTAVQPSLWNRLPELRRPTLLLAGELDTKFVTINREMAALIPAAQLEIVPGAGHTIHLERPQQWGQAVITFLESLRHH